VLGIFLDILMGGAIVGAAGGVAAGQGIDMGLNDEYLKSVGESLGSGSSAIVALVTFERVERAMEELDKFEGGTILRHTLSDEVYQQLSGLLRTSAACRIWVVCCPFKGTRRNPAEALLLPHGAQI